MSSTEERLAAVISELVQEKVSEALKNKNTHRVTPADYRIRKGFRNVETLAAACGVDRRIIHRAERGRMLKYQEQTTANLIAVASELGVNPTEYLKVVRDHSEANRTKQ
jgi:transcriptional regulator with XRE-family HTH domain